MSQHDKFCEHGECDCNPRYVDFSYEHDFRCPDTWCDCNRVEVIRADEREKVVGQIKRAWDVHTGGDPGYIEECGCEVCDAYARAIAAVEGGVASGS